jgi:peptide/nickel transport system permease protein
MYKQRVRDSWNIYKKNKSALVGLFIVSVMFFIAAFGKSIAPRDPWKMGDDSYSPPCAEYFFGTDDLGRDIFSGVLYGARVSILIGFLSAATSLTIGTIVGSLSGYFGGRVDDVLMRFTELFQIIPRFFLIILLVAVMGPSIWNVIFVIGVLSWPGNARLVRAQFLSLKEREFVDACKMLGMSNFQIIFGEIFPNAIQPLIVSTSLEMAFAIKTEAGLSFLGLGDPNVMSWGLLLHNAQQILRYGWWLSAIPGMAIFVTVLALNLVGDGLSDVVNPRLRER